MISIAKEFFLTEEEEQEIKKWQANHLAEKHPEAVDNPNYFAPIGGEWSYVFIPTTIGICGEVCCYCGEKHIFRSFL